MASRFAETAIASRSGHLPCPPGLLITSANNQADTLNYLVVYNRTRRAHDGSRVHSQK
jgi:hypothetical protein